MGAVPVMVGREVIRSRVRFSESWPERHKEEDKLIMEHIASTGNFLSGLLILITREIISDLLFLRELKFE